MCYVTGDNQSTIASSNRLSLLTVSTLIKKTSNVIWSALMKGGFLHVPKTECQWIPYEIFLMQLVYWKNTHWQAPHNSRTAHFNNKTTHSVAWLGICNAKYHFRLVDIGDWVGKVTILCMQIANLFFVSKGWMVIQNVFGVMTKILHILQTYSNNCRQKYKSYEGFRCSTQFFSKW